MACHLRRPNSLLVSRAAILSLLVGLSSSLAAPSAAALLPASGTFILQIAATLSVDLGGSGSASSIGGPGSAHTIPAGFFSIGPTAASVQIQPTFTGLDHFTVPAGVQNAAGSFGPNGSMPLLGTGAFFGPGGSFAGIVPLSPIGGTGSAPFQMGGLIGTVLGATFRGAGGPTPLVVQFASAALAIPITVTATAYDNRTAGGVGAVQLVAPATGSLGIFGALPMFGLVQIEYTPEPSSWLLVAGGLAALGAGARSSRSRSR